MCVCTNVENVLLDSVYELSLILSINLKYEISVKWYLINVHFCLYWIVLLHTVGTTKQNITLIAMSICFVMKYTISSDVDCELAEYNIGFHLRCIRLIWVLMINSINGLL